MDDKQAVQVTIFHQTYTFRVSGDAGELAELADRVDQLMTAIAAHSPTADTLKVAVHACLELAGQLRGMEHDLAQLRQRVEQKSERFRLLLEQALETPGDRQ